MWITSWWPTAQSDSWADYGRHEDLTTFSNARLGQLRPPPQRASRPGQTKPSISNSDQSGDLTLRLVFWAMMLNPLESGKGGGVRSAFPGLGAGGFRGGKNLRAGTHNGRSPAIAGGEFCKGMGEAEARPRPQLPHPVGGGDHGMMVIWASRARLEDARLN
jgi:hypothetical protein